MGIYIPERVALRAATNCTEDDHGCMISGYSVASHGYAQIGWQVGENKRQATTAHRAAWVHANGRQIPDGMTVDHLCRVRRCVNPAHLRLLTNLDNARDNGQSHRHAPLIWLGRTCRKGHDLLAWVSGGTTCRECPRDSDRRAAARKQAQLTP